MSNDKIWINDVIANELAFDPMSDKDSGVTLENGFVHISDLLKEVERQECKKFKFYFNSAFLGSGRELNSMIDWVHHVNRVNKADITKPIIVGWTGYILDGYHRVAKALLEGKTWIWAYRLKDPVSESLIKKP